MTLYFSIITCSDSRDESTDTAGRALQELIEDSGWTVVDRIIVTDELDEIKGEIIHSTDELNVDIVLTCGGTGLSQRDVTPEATALACDRNVAGIAEVMRSYSLTKTKFAALSRGVAMQRGKTLVIDFPGSEKAARENWEAISDILPHAIKMANGGGH